MSEITISLNNVSKCYKRYANPTDRLKELLLPGKSRADEFWALRNINLDIPKGQTLGIVGRNGSGKSTLLQIIAGTLTATTGEVKVKGRISALLELGSGFNPEFTGRQNVFFNGRLLGLDQKEIETKFDEIAAFADIGDFIEQPVKTYSSGMFVRLAFAVATSVEPDILIVDEALAVGDAAFGRKCFARIKGIQDRGGTILFVSHTAAAVIELCDVAILIDHGELLLSGKPKLVTSNYHKLTYAPIDEQESLRDQIRNLNNQIVENQLENKNIWEADLDRLSQKPTDFYDPNMLPQSTIVFMSRGAEIDQPYITTLEGERVNILTKRKEYLYIFHVQFYETAYKVRFGMLIKTVSGLEIGGVVSHPINEGIDCVTKGQVIKVEFKFQCLVRTGVYFFNAAVVGLVDGVEVFLHRKVDAAMFRVDPEENVRDITYGIVDFYPESNFYSIQEISQ
jgi:lipopolysaccharide transport system ATP-binding protein